jgi:hypothetical protein
MNSEEIYAALFNKLSGIQGVATISRILQHWDDVPSSAQPAIFMTCIGQTEERIKGFPAKIKLEAKIYIYTNRGTNSEVPSIQLNNIIDEIRNSLQPSANSEYKETLSGKVEICKIDGAILTDEGTLGTQAVAIIPISMIKAY